MLSVEKDDRVVGDTFPDEVIAHVNVFCGAVYGKGPLPVVAHRYYQVRGRSTETRPV